MSIPHELTITKILKKVENLEQEVRDGRDEIKELKNLVSSQNEMLKERK